MEKLQSEILTNPFSVKTPENLSATEIVDLFVPYPEFENLQVSGHQFLDGHRGSGKSMMLRMMAPDSLMLYRNCSLMNLPYFGVYLSIKATELNAPEYSRLEKEPSGSILSEHVLATKLMSALFSSVRSHCISHIREKNLLQQLRLMIEKLISSRLKYAGWTASPPDNWEAIASSIEDLLNFVVVTIDDIQVATAQYIKRRSFGEGNPAYQGALLGFQDILLPTVKDLVAGRLIPQAPVYFLLDDADNLTEQQTQILNTWVAYRSTDITSLKISTQLNYKTYRTTSGARIEAPHDFSSINFTSVHTGSIKERYPKLVANIVEKRLAKYGLSNTDPHLFFPPNVQQEEKIKEIYEEIKSSWEKGKSGFRANDDAYRYARPEYIRRLSGDSRQGSKYQYSGFDQLVHISSGIIRFFLEPASRMFTEQAIMNGANKVTSISPSIQNQELRKQADQLLLQDFDKLIDEATEDNKHQAEDIKKLRNLVTGIGSLFRAHIMQENISQRRVFSFSISGEVSQEVRSILKIGAIHGYFYIDSIGAKEGMGRKNLYVLTRRLAPAFSLDPVGFSGYLTLTDSALREMMEKPMAFINRLRKYGVSDEAEQQLSLLSDQNHE